MTAAASYSFSTRLDRRALAYAGLCLAVFGWASAFVAGKVALAEIAPLSTAAWRFAIATLVLLPFAWRQRPRVQIGRTARPLLVMIVCGGVLCPALFHMGLAQTSATNASLLMALSPALTILVAPLIGEMLTGRRIIGVSIALFGAAFVIFDGNIDAALSLSFSRGDLLVLLVAGGMVGLHLSSQRVVIRLAPSFTSFVVLGTGSVFLFFLARNDAPVSQLMSATPAAVVSIMVMAVFSSAIAGQCFLNGVRTIGVSRSVVFVYLIPVATALLSAVLLDEPVEAAQAVGGVTVLAGVYTATR